VPSSLRQHHLDSGTQDHAATIGPQRYEERSRAITDGLREQPAEGGYFAGLRPQTLELSVLPSEIVGAP
jgi:hypothetical protein